MKRVFLILCVVLFIWVGCSRSSAPSVTGTWQIDAKATIDRGVASGQLPEEQRGKWLGRFEKMSEAYQMVITEDHILTQKFKVPYEMKLGENGDVLLQAVFENEEVILTYTPLKEGGFLFRSSATNDMDDLVWRKLP